MSLLRHSQHCARWGHGCISYLHGSITTTVRVLGRHAHPRTAKDGWRRSWAVGSASRARVVLRTTPAEAHTRVANWVALHLVDGHLGSMALHELDETAPLARWYLDVRNLAKALEEGPELILGDVARQATNEDGRIVRVGELVHGLGSAVVAHGGCAHRVHAHTARAATLLRHAAHSAGTTRSAALVLGSRGANAHRAVAAVDALHLGQGLLLVLLVGKANEAVAARHSADGIRHDLGRLGGRVLVLEQLDKDELGDLGAQVADEDAVLGATLVAAAAVSVCADCGRGKRS